MKTIMRANGNVMRIKDEEASKLVEESIKLVDGTREYEYCPKSEWKKSRRIQKGQQKNHQ